LHNYYHHRFGYRKGDYPIAENVYLSEMSLPLYPGLKKEEFEYTVEKLKNVIKKYS
jgi:dTDP-4-amino-4,6-dideoxygalactose transaminase